MHVELMDTRYVNRNFKSKRAINIKKSLTKSPKSDAHLIIGKENLQNLKKKKMMKDAGVPKIWNRCTHINTNVHSQTMVISITACDREPHFSAHNGIIFKSK